MMSTTLAQAKLTSCALVACLLQAYVEHATKGKIWKAVALAMACVNISRKKKGHELTHTCGKGKKSILTAQNCLNGANNGPSAISKYVEAKVKSGTGKEQCSPERHGMLRFTNNGAGLLRGTRHSQLSTLSRTLGTLSRLGRGQ